jgi:hypothetical protein
VICHAPSRNDDYIDIVIAALGEPAADQIRHLRISLPNGEDVNPAGSNLVDTASAAVSIFQHLPLAGLRSDSGTVTFEDEKHLYAIESGSQRARRFRIRSFPKPREEVAQHIYLGPGSVSGLLTLTPVVCEFRPYSQSGHVSIKTKCPHALGSLLQSSKQLKSVLGGSSRGSATLYLLHISSAGSPEIWKIEVSTVEGELFIKQMKPKTTQQEFTNGTVDAYDEVQIVKKGGNPESVGECSVLRLACVKGGSIDYFDISVEEENFSTLHSQRLGILPKSLKRVSIDAFGKIATSRSILSFGPI